MDSNLVEEQRESGSLVLSYMPSLNEVTHILQSGEVEAPLTTQVRLFSNVDFFFLIS
jgi:exosome complex component MTR3